jgi:hypothetical protein
MQTIRTIHHGLPERLLMPQSVRPAYFAFLGRISPEKAVDQAIWIAKRCGAPLKIAAKIDAVDRGYFQWREATSAFPMCGRHEIALNAPQKTTASR